MIPSTNNRIWNIAGALVIIAALVGGWFLGVSPQLDAMNRANSDREQLVDRNALAELQIAALKKQFEKLPELEAELAEVRKSVPEVSNLETFTAEIRAAELASGATVLAINYEAAQPFLPVGDFATLVPPSVDMTKFAVIPFTVSARGGRDNLVTLLDGIQNTPRLAVSNSLAFAGDGAEWGLDVHGFVYVLLEEALVAPPVAPTTEEPAAG